MMICPKSIRITLATILLGTIGLRAQTKPKLDRLIVYGKDFAFTVKEPDGWRGDTGTLASKYQTNIVFLPDGEASRAQDVTIRVRVNTKTDENTTEDLNYDMQKYEKEFPAAQFSVLDVTHPEYKTFARTVFVPHVFWEYVAYLNPGPRKPLIFSVAMSKKNLPASDDELKAYKAILNSVQWFTSSVTEKP
jgi:hypothetical protein